MNATDDTIETAVIEQAGEWYARHREGSLSPTEIEAFMVWLQRSPLHVREYLAAAQVAAHLPAAAAGLQADREALIDRARLWLREQDNVVELRSTPAPAAVQAGGSGRFMRRGRRVAAFAAVLVLGITGGFYWQLGTPGLSGWPQVLEVPRGEQRTVQLRDGSMLHLNADTRVRVRYSGDRRLIDLERGQALFKVAPNSARPFVVRAGEADVIAVGTEFDVRRRGLHGAVTVTVVEGKVDVLSNAPGRSGSAIPAASDSNTAAVATPTRVNAGERLRLDFSSPAPSPEPVDVHMATAWLRRQLAFSEQPLAEVAEEFSRYGTPIAIESAVLREYRVSGVFNAYDTESFVAYLRRIGEVEHTAQGIVVR